jgi:chlorite dismutase
MDEDAWELIRREQEKTKERELVRFSFYRVDPAWRRLEADDKARHRDELVDLVARHARELMVFSYSMIGTRGDCDFLLWQAARDVAPLHDLEAGIRATGLGAYLSLPHSFFSMTRRSIYVNRYEEEYVARYGGDEPLDRARIALNPEGARYLFVYPFVKTREWYALPAEERQRMMDEHIHVGHRWPDVKLNTTYSYGLDDQEFVVAFETDHIGRFLDLLMELRLTDASRYTLRDTPSFTCISMPLERCLEALG